MCAKYPFAGEMCLPYWPKNRGYWDKDRWITYCRWRPHAKGCTKTTAAPTRAGTPVPTPWPTATATPHPTPAFPWARPKTLRTLMRTLPAAPTPLPTPLPPPLQPRWAAGLCMRRYTFYESTALCIDRSGKRKTYAVQDWQLRRARLRQACHHNQFVSKRCVTFWNRDSVTWSVAEWFEYCQWEPAAKGCKGTITPAPTPLTPAPTVHDVPTPVPTPPIAVPQRSGSPAHAAYYMQPFAQQQQLPHTTTSVPLADVPPDADAMLDPEAPAPVPSPAPFSAQAPLAEPPGSFFSAGTAVVTTPAAADVPPASEFGGQERVRKDGTELLQLQQKQDRRDHLARRPL